MTERITCLPLRNRAVNQGDSRYSERENPEKRLPVSGETFAVLLGPQAERMETENRGGCVKRRNPAWMQGKRQPPGDKSTGFLARQELPIFAGRILAPAAGLEPATRWLQALLGFPQGLDYLIIPWPEDGECTKAR